MAMQRTELPEATAASGVGTDPLETATTTSTSILGEPSANTLLLVGESPLVIVSTSSSDVSETSSTPPRREWSKVTVMKIQERLGWVIENDLP
jgi:hypothetical protein